MIIIFWIVIVIYMIAFILEEVNRSNAEKKAEKMAEISEINDIATPLHEKFEELVMNKMYIKNPEELKQVEKEVKELKSQIFMISIYRQNIYNRQ